MYYAAQRDHGVVHGSLRKAKVLRKPVDSKNVEKVDSRLLLFNNLQFCLFCIGIGKFVWLSILKFINPFTRNVKIHFRRELPLFCASHRGQSCVGSWKNM